MCPGAGVLTGVIALPLSSTKHVDSAGLEFSAVTDWLYIEMTLLDVLHVNLADICGIKILSDHRAVVKFLFTDVYLSFVRKVKDRTLPLPCGAGTVVISDR